MLLFIGRDGRILGRHRKIKPTFEGSMDVVLAAKAVADIGGHYSRSDILRLLIDRRPIDRISDAALQGDVPLAPSAS